MLNLKNPTLFKEKNLTAEGWVEAGDKASVEVRNPFDNSCIGKVPSLSEAEVKQAVEAAQPAQKQWAKLTAEARAEIMQKWAALIDENIDDLALLIATEGGKVMTEAKGEVKYANSFIKWFAEEAKRVNGDIIPSKANDLRYLVLKQPIGVCAAITPWNFPAAMITRKVAPALASGCAMLVKPAGATPFTALALGELALQAGIPKGVLQFVTGSSRTIGKIFTTHPIIRKISFTGSTQVGRALMEQSASSIKKVSMELGGNAPFIVFEDADIDAAVQGLMAAKFRNSGQTCVCANRIYIQESIRDKFVSSLLSAVKNLNIGNPLDESSQIGPLINKEGLEKVDHLVTDAIEKGASCLAGGKQSDVSGLSYQPTVLVDINTDMEIADEEIFGPVIAIQTFKDEAEVIKRANDTIFGLAAYFYSNNLSRAWRVTEQLEYGMVGHNTGLISSEVAPFGGVKQSGVGREGSQYGIDEYLEMKYWCTNI